MNVQGAVKNFRLMMNTKLTLIRYTRVYGLTVVDYAMKFSKIKKNEVSNRYSVSESKGSQGPRKP